MRNPPLPPLPTPDHSPQPQRPRITHRLWSDWADETQALAGTEERARYADEAPTRAVLTRPIHWSGELDAPTIGNSTPFTSPLISGPLGALPERLHPASPRRRIRGNEWMLLVASIGIVVLLVAAVAAFGLFKLSPPSPSGGVNQPGAATVAIPTATATLAPTATATPLPAIASSYAGLDATTQGNWQVRYSSGGYMIVGDTQQLPQGVQVTPGNQQEAVWQDSTSDPRALQKATDPTNRIAAAWYSDSSFTLNVNVTDGQTYQLALYFVDWDQQNRAEIINILDPTTDAVLDARSVTAFANGEYLVWNVRGHVVIQITNAPGSVNAVVSGLFIAPLTTTPGATPAATPSDTSTPGQATPTLGPDGTPTDTPIVTPLGTPSL